MTVLRYKEYVVHTDSPKERWDQVLAAVAKTDPEAWLADPKDSRSKKMNPPPDAVDSEGYLKILRDPRGT